MKKLGVEIGDRVELTTPDMPPNTNATVIAFVKMGKDILPVVRRDDGDGWLVDWVCVKGAITGKSDCWILYPGEFSILPKRKLAKAAQVVLDILNDKGSVTAVEAAAVNKVRSLSRRICDLIEAGHKITKEMRKDHTGQRYVRYYLVRG